MGPASVRLMSERSSCVVAAPAASATTGKMTSKAASVRLPASVRHPSARQTSRRTPAFSTSIARDERDAASASGASADATIAARCEVRSREKGAASGNGAAPLVPSEDAIKAERDSGDNESPSDHERRGMLGFCQRLRLWWSIQHINFYLRACHFNTWQHQRLICICVAVDRSPIRGTWGSDTTHLSLLPSGATDESRHRVSGTMLVPHDWRPTVAVSLLRFVPVANCSHSRQWYSVSLSVHVAQCRCTACELLLPASS